eukprot:484407_1
MALLPDFPSPSPIPQEEGYIRQTLPSPSPFSRSSCTHSSLSESRTRSSKQAEIDLTSDDEVQIVRAQFNSMNVDLKPPAMSEECSSYTHYTHSSSSKSSAKYRSSRDSKHNHDSKQRRKQSEIIDRMLTISYTRGSRDAIDMTVTYDDEEEEVQFICTRYDSSDSASITIDLTGEPSISSMSDSSSSVNDCIAEFEQMNMRTINKFKINKERFNDMTKKIKTILSAKRNLQITNAQYEERTVCLCISLCDVIRQTIMNKEGHSDKDPPTILICSATRNSALYIYRLIDSVLPGLARIVTGSYGLCHTSYGAHSIISATPGKLIYLLKTKQICLGNVSCMVMEQADMLINSDSLRSQMKTISNYLSPGRWIRLIWVASSSDYPKEDMETTSVLDYSKERMDIIRRKKHFFKRGHGDTLDDLKKILQWLQHRRIERVVVFFATKYRLRKVLKLLMRDKRHCKIQHIDHICGDHPVIQREQILNSFFNNQTRDGFSILLSTDLISGSIVMDAHGTSAINYDFSNYWPLKSYLDRCSNMQHVFSLSLTRQLRQSLSKSKIEMVDFEMQRCRDRRDRNKSRERRREPQREGYRSRRYHGYNRYHRYHRRSLF